jgi:hypothetical protein
VAVTGDSPEKQRGGIIGHCHGAADQAWSSAAVAAAVVFQTDRRRAAPYRPPPHSGLPGCMRSARWSSGLERILLNLASDATYFWAGNRIVSVGTA